MGKIVKFNVVDSAGTGVAGQTINTGAFEITTGKGGLAQALLEDGHAVITVNGLRVYDGPVAALQPVETFTTSGQRRT